MSNNASDRRPLTSNAVRLASVFSPACIEQIEGKPGKAAILEQLVRSLANSHHVKHCAVAD
jgi:hypothetical protein